MKSINIFKMSLDYFLSAYNFEKIDYDFTNISFSFLQSLLSRGMLLNLDFSLYLYSKYSNHFTKCMWRCYTQRLIMSNIVNDQLILKYKPFCIWYCDLPNENTLKKLLKFDFMHDSVAVVCILKNNFYDFLDNLNLINPMYIYDLCLLINRKNYFEIIPKYPYNLKNIESYLPGIDAPYMYNYFPNCQQIFTEFLYEDLIRDNFYSDDDCPNHNCKMLGIFGYGLEMNEFVFELAVLDKFVYNYKFKTYTDLITQILLDDNYFKNKCFAEFYIVDIFVKIDKLKDKSSKIEKLEDDLDSMIIKSHLNNIYESDFKDCFLYFAAISGNKKVYEDQLVKNDFKKYDLNFNYYLYMTGACTKFKILS